VSHECEGPIIDILIIDISDIVRDTAFVATSSKTQPMIEQDGRSLLLTGTMQIRRDARHEKEGKKKEENGRGRKRKEEKRSTRRANINAPCEAEIAQWFHRSVARSRSIWILGNFNYDIRTVLPNNYMPDHILRVDTGGPALPSFRALYVPLGCARVEKVAARSRARASP